MNLENNKKILVLTLILGALIVVTWVVGTRKLGSEIAAISLNSGLPTKTGENRFDVPAESALVVSADLKTIYYDKNIKVKRPIASLTKLISAMVVLENYNLAESIEVPAEAINPPDSKNILRAGETLKAFDLLAALLIGSSNEAAYTLALNWPSPIGTLEFKKQKFIEAMNQKAASLHLENTHFSDPAGLDDTENFSTAWDLALMTKYALNYPLIKQLTTKEDFVTYSEEGIYHKFENSNKLLKIWPEIRLGKTGFTDGAGPSLALVVEEQKQPLIVILLNAQDRFTNTEELLQKLNLLK